MRIAMCGVMLLVVGACCVRAQQAGMQNDWDVHKTLAAIAVHADRLAPYAAQAKGCRDEVRGIAAAARALSQNPDKLTEELQLLFRIRTFESRLASLGEGLRKYQNPPMADMLSSGVAENAGNLQRLEQYVLELSAAKDQEFHVADQEAQRCRQSLSRQPKQEKD